MNQENTDAQEHAQHMKDLKLSFMQQLIKGVANQNREMFPDIKQVEVIKPLPLKDAA